MILIARYLLAVSVVGLGACGTSGYQEHEIGDELELVSPQGGGVGPDVVFYRDVEGVVTGVRRLGDAKSTASGYWSKCQLFRASSHQVRYLDPEEQEVASLGPEFGEALTFAKARCRNFGAMGDRQLG